MSRRSIGVIAALALAAIGSNFVFLTKASAPEVRPRFVQQPKTDTDRFINAALRQIGVTKTYNPGYVRIPYPNGDVPIGKGVCTDVVIRALREAGTDLQVSIHEDAKKFPRRYPRIGSLDSNIDHRRCPNMAAFLEAHAKSLTVELKAPDDWKAGDIVFWKLSGGKDHVGVLSAKQNSAGFPFVVHNIGAGVSEEDVLGNWKLVKRFRLPIRGLNESRIDQSELWLHQRLF